jgi:hypothetical protein
MPQSITPPEPEILATLRRLLLIAVLVGTIGMGTELLLVGHVDGALQMIPVALLAVGAAALVWCALTARAAAVRLVQVAMTLFVLSGVAGVVLHYRGNEAFELEMYPTMTGLELIRETLTGATPVLAPGSMTLLGLVGWALTYRHPSLARAGATRNFVEAQS